MGANQSSGSEGHEGADRSSQTVKTCYYELLGIDATASDDEWATPSCVIALDANSTSESKKRIDVKH